MKNKKAVEDAIFSIAKHMSQCSACVEALVSAGDAKADPGCAEYQRLKAVAKALADR